MRRFRVPWRLALAVLAVEAVLSLACDSPAVVTGNARILNGATPGASSSARVRDTAQAPAVAAIPRPTPRAAPSDGRWTVSPNQVQVRLMRLQFFAGGSDRQVVDLGPDCVVTYDKAAASLSTRLDCPFEVAVGTYDRLTVDFAPDFEVLIDDETNGLFTDPASPTLFSPTPPAGGDGFVDYPTTIPDGGDAWSATTFLTAPLVVTEEQPVALDIVVHGLHTFQIEVTDGAPAFYTDPQQRGWPVQLYPSVNGVSTSEYYSSVASADTFAFGSVPNPAHVLMFYETSTVPATANFEVGESLGGCGRGMPHATNAAADDYEVNEGGGRPGGYLGLDGDTLCWAQGSDEGYSGYNALFSLTRLTSEGATGTLSCVPTSEAPPPSSGATYSSGCPPLVAPQQIDVTLVAN